MSTMKLRSNPPLELRSYDCAAGNVPSPPAKPERSRMKKSKSDPGKLCSRQGSADVRFLQNENEPRGRSSGCRVEDFSASAKHAHAMALSQRPVRRRLGLLRKVSSSSNDLTTFDTGGFDSFSAPLLSASTPATHNPSDASPINGDSSARNIDEEDTDSFMMKLVKDRQRLTLGRVSIFMLLIFAATDYVLHAAGIHVRPTTGIVSLDEIPMRDRPELSLGAAAITSITESLSPILPFTGGLDLRREDYWQHGVFGSFASIARQVRDAFSHRRAAARSEQEYSGEVNSTLARHIGERTPIEIKHVLSMSAQTPFVSREKIAELSLSDMATIYQYALESSRPSFDSAKLIKNAGPHLRDVLRALDKATVASRGTQVPPAVTSEGGKAPTPGDMDALNFCAATRILAEWRIVRQVPDGYKGYAAGMNLGFKDVVQNLAKIEKAIHALIDERAASGAGTLRSPTLYELLKHEIDSDIQNVNKLPRLQERTAGMGLLWVRRQLEYQQALFTKFLQVGEVYDTTNAALNAAYSEVYGKFHGWAVQKIFSYSFQAAPEVSEIFKIMNPRRLEEVMSEPLPGAGKMTAASMMDKASMPTNRSKPNKAKKVVTSIIGFFVDRFGNKSKSASKSPVGVAAAMPPRGGASAEKAQTQVTREEYVSSAMTDDARITMRVYLSATKPIIESLEQLFDELNMNDPTKV